MSFDTYKERRYSVNQHDGVWDVVAHNADNKDGWVIVDYFKTTPINLTNVGNEVRVTVHNQADFDKLVDALHVAGFGDPL